MSLARTLGRRQRRIEPRVVGRLARLAARVHVHQSGIPAGVTEAAAVRDVVRALRAGELVAELDQVTAMVRIARP